MSNNQKKSKKNNTNKPQTAKKTNTEVKEKEEVKVEEVKATPKKEEKKVVKNETKKVEKKETKKEEKKVEELKEVKKDEEKKAEVKISKINTDKVVIFSIVGFCILVALGVFFFVFYKSNYEAVVDTDYGMVNKNEYTVYYKMFAPMLEYYGYQSTQIPSVIANKAGTDKIILAKAKEANVTLSDEDKAAIDKVFSDKDQISTWQQSGINISILRKLYEEDYIITAYINKLAEDASDEDILKYIKETYGENADLYEYNTRHILLKTTTTGEDGTSSKMSDEQKTTVFAKAQGLLARALAGEDFATLAKENSEDGTASDGGAFTFYDGDSIYEEYEKASKSLEAGQVYAQIVETDAGYHIIKLDSKVENGRSKSSTIRSSYANEKVNNLSTSEKIDIKTDVLNKLIETITGVATTTDTDNSTSDTDDSTDASTQSTDSTTQESTQEETPVVTE